MLYTDVGALNNPTSVQSKAWQDPSQSSGHLLCMAPLSHSVQTIYCCCSAEMGIIWEG